MKCNVLLLRKNNTIKWFKRSMPDRSIKIEDNIYIIPPGAVMQKGFKTYLFLRESDLMAVTSQSETTSMQDIQDLITGIIGDDSIRKFLGQNPINYLVLALLGLTALFLGIIIGIALYPHIVQSVISTGVKS